MMRCPACDTELIPMINFDLEDYGHEGEGMVTEYTCPSCESMFIHIEKENDDK